MSRQQRSSHTAFPYPGSALLSTWQAGYSRARLKSDIMAGLTIGVVAVPLSMALAIATGVAPQHGLYTAIVAGIVIALTGGSRFNISGPTAAFVVILFPIVANYGIGGLLIATLMAGMILLALGLARLGSLIQYVPYPVVLGFTAGIGTVIALLQLPDFFGLSDLELGDSTVENAWLITRALPDLAPAELAIGVITLATLLLWPRLKTPVPAPLAGLAVGTLAAILMAMLGVEVDTIASRFHWTIDGQSGSGIPPLAPSFSAPWHFPGANGEPLTLNFALIQALLGPALAISLLAAIESLLCAVVADGLTRTRHDPNAELIGQGIGNIVVPFFWRHHCDRGAGAYRDQYQKRCLFAHFGGRSLATGTAGRGGAGGHSRPRPHGRACRLAVDYRVEHERSKKLCPYAKERHRKRCRGAGDLLCTNGRLRYGHCRRRRH